MDDPQRYRHAAKENRRTIMTIRQRWRHRSIDGPDERAGKSQQIRQRVRRYILQRNVDIKAFSPNGHEHANRRDKGTGECTPHRTRPSGNRSRHQHQQRRPQIVDKTDLDGLGRGRCKADRQRDGRLVEHEHQTTDKQIHARIIADRFRPTRYEQHYAANGVDHRGTERGPEIVGDNTHQSRHEPP